ncbi:MAG: hypothetical protein AAGA18_00910 [Verrucomicrobiota bacterium]
MSICGFTIAIGDQTLAQAYQLRKSFKHHHPEIPFFILDSKAFYFLTDQICPGRICEIIGIRAVAGWFLSKFFERVIYLDSDIVIFSRLEALLDSDSQALLTHDVHNCFLGPKGAARINSGVLMAQTEIFWIKWVEQIYCYLTPIINSIIDQQALRVIHQHKLVEADVLDEDTHKVSYNNRVLSLPGHYFLEGQKVFKGDIELKLFHWAGCKVRDMSYFPNEIQNLVESYKDSELLSEKDQKDWQALCDSSPKFVGEVMRLVKNISLKFYEDKFLEKYYDACPGIYWTFLPRRLEVCRKISRDDIARVPNDGNDYFLYIDKKIHSGFNESTMRHLSSMFETASAFS